MAVITETRDIHQGRFTLLPRNLKDTVSIALPLAIQEEDSSPRLAEEASEAYTQVLIDHPELGATPSKRARVRFVKQSLFTTDAKTARLLGITENQVQRMDLRARRKEEMGQFDTRLQAAVAVAGILDTHISGYPDAHLDRRAALNAPHTELAGFSTFRLLEAGFGNIAVAQALRAVRTSREAMGQQRGSW